VLLETLGAGEPDLKELLDTLEELHVVGAVVLGVRHPRRRRRRRRRRRCRRRRSVPEIAERHAIILPLSLSLLFLFAISFRVSRTRFYGSHGSTRSNEVLVSYTRIGHSQKKHSTLGNARS